MKEPVIIGDATLYHADCLDVLPTLDPVETCITDPPYGLSFMGKEWDHGVPGKPFWEALQLKPGGLLLAFGGTRTFHRLTCAIEDAGYEIRDCLMWLYGSGFPKSHDISKAIDKHLGLERQVELIPTKRGNAPNQAGDISLGATGMTDISQPATREAQLWDGWGTALKPAWEPIIVAMKPLDGTFADNALRHGVAGLNIDGCRINTGDELGRLNKHGPYTSGRTINISKTPAQDSRNKNNGRFPANVIHDGSDEVMDEFDKAGNRPTGGGRKGESGKRVYLDNVKSGSLSGIRSGGTIDDKIYKDDRRGDYILTQVHNDLGSAARFFYCAKASNSERNAGCGGLPNGPAPGSKRSKPDEGRKSALGTERKNFHPTVKPVALMRYLCMLTSTPTGGTVIDPFMGSGSTGVACGRLGRKFIGIEINKEYFDIAYERIDREYAQGKLFTATA